MVDDTLGSDLAGDRGYLAPPRRGLFFLPGHRPNQWKASVRAAGLMRAFAASPGWLARQRRVGVPRGTMAPHIFWTLGKVLGSRLRRY
jgi:hypothetical protein